MYESREVDVFLCLVSLLGHSLLVRAPLVLQTTMLISATSGCEKATLLRDIYFLEGVLKSTNEYWD